MPKSFGSKQQPDRRCLIRGLRPAGDWRRLPMELTGRAGLLVELLPEGNLALGRLQSHRRQTPTLYNELLH